MTMLPSITLREYAEMVARGGNPGVVAIVWRAGEYGRQTILDEFIGGGEVGHKLKHLLSELVFEAELHPNTPQRLNLGNGLKIDIVIVPGDDPRVKLQISRIGVYPSHNEWRIVLRDWPYPVPDGIKAQEFTHAGRCYLKAEWPAPARLFDGIVTEIDVDAN